jgi:DNA-binding protein HU-beta
MNKAELALKLSERLNVPKRSSEQFLETFEQLIMSALKEGQEVTIAGFGTFSARTRSARMGVNPRNPSQKIQVPEVRVPKFKAGKGLKDALKSPAPQENSAA